MTPAKPAKRPIHRNVVFIKPSARKGHEQCAFAETPARVQFNERGSFDRPPLDLFDAG